MVTVLQWSCVVNKGLRGDSVTVELCCKQGFVVACCFRLVMAAL